MADRCPFFNKVWIPPSSGLVLLPVYPYEFQRQLHETPSPAMQASLHSKWLLPAFPFFCFCFRFLCLVVLFKTLSALQCIMNGSGVSRNVQCTQSKVLHQGKKKSFSAGRCVLVSNPAGKHAQVPLGFTPGLRGPVPCFEQTELSLTLLSDWLTQRDPVSREK